jgi:hypothetical protein
MPKPKGTPKTGGRRPGTRNKTTLDIRTLAAPYGPDAVKTLASLMCDEAQPPEVRLKACAALLDRGYGKPVEYKEVTGHPGNEQSLKNLTDEELNAEIKRVLVELENDY